MRIWQAIPLVICVATFASSSRRVLAQTAIPLPVPIDEESTRYLSAIEAHMDYVTEHSLDQLGDAKTPMWLATIDLRSNGLPDDPMPGHLRWYRKITSPQGSNIYWDQPTVVAAYELSRRTGCACYEDAADAYVRVFLERCVAEPSGLFEWGNHRYYDVVRDEVVSFSGGYHECRPHTPAWETFWDIDPEATRRMITAMATAHVKDPRSGLFCRHANPDVEPGLFEKGEIDGAMPFLEAGAVLIDSLTWLADKTDQRDGAAVAFALQIARYSDAQRGEATSLVRNQPVKRRWDYFASTTEIGLWAGSLLRAAERTGDGEFQRMAEHAVRPWLRLGYDDAAKKYFGALSVDSGRPVVPPEPRGYEPPMYAEVFDLQTRPTHNHPMPFAEACLGLYERTEETIYRDAVERWVEHVRQSLPANDGHGGYAEDYGRVIHFLVRAGQVLQEPRYRELAVTVADEAMEQLYVPKMGMFRSHPEENRCDAVDGPGVLLLALMYLESASLEPSAYAF